MDEVSRDITIERLLKELALFHEFSMQILNDCQGIREEITTPSKS